MGSTKRIRAKRLKRRMEKLFEADKDLRRRRRYVYAGGRRRRVLRETLDKYIVLWPETEQSLRYLAEQQL